ncbi:site-specific recombinase XerD [Neisseria sp. HSC-16F19]|nr:tyrosine-type recombinase/integrase [Neisseria sp. HSC-16F19]MCP2041141.1 site-specific recombinase XerD [Neisseria sp. HSC-16F19]
MTELSLLPPEAAGHPNADIAAIMQWLAARGNRSANTFEAYKRTAEKFINWVYSEGKSLPELTVNDITCYLSALEEAGLKPASVNYNRTILNQMFQYLVDLGHIQKNIIKLAPIPAVEVGEEPTRFLDLDAWVWLWQWLTSRPALKPKDININIRDRWLFALIYHTGLRREEVAKGSMSDIQYRNGRWALKVVGKRHKIRHVSINSLLLQELKQYRTALGLDELPSSGEKYGLVIPLKGDQTRRLTPRAIGLMIFECKEKALLDCEEDYIRVQLSDMSTHWLRHTNTTHRYMAGASSETIQDEQGHADPKTTRTYLKTLPGKRSEDAEKLAQLHANAVTGKN